MMIPVVLKNGNEQKVYPQVLDKMLAAEQVMFFKRTSGWVVVGRDRIRAIEQTIYTGQEKRGKLPNFLTLS